MVEEKGEEEDLSRVVVAGIKGSGVAEPFEKSLNFNAKL